MQFASLKVFTMKFKVLNAFVFIGISFSLGACSDKPAEPAHDIARTSTPAEAIQDNSPAAVNSTDQWLGQWNGPEGTFLRLEADGGKYTVTIQNLDGPRSFEGISSGNTIRFERDSVQESIHASNGAETGMKWLSEKSNCLTVRTGEGYCRD